MTRAVGRASVAVMRSRRPPTPTLTLGPTRETKNGVRTIVTALAKTDGISTMTISAPHTLRLVARDERGATRTAVKTVGCQ